MGEVLNSSSGTDLFIRERRGRFEMQSHEEESLIKTEVGPGVKSLQSRNAGDCRSPLEKGDSGGIKGTNSTNTLILDFCPLEL